MFISMFLAFAAVADVGPFHGCTKGDPEQGTPSVPVYVCSLGVADAYASALKLFVDADKGFAEQSIDRRLGIPPKIFQSTCSPDGSCRYFFILKIGDRKDDWRLDVSGRDWDGENVIHPGARFFSFDATFARSETFDTQCLKMDVVNEKIKTSGWASSRNIPFPVDGYWPGPEAVFDKTDETRLVLNNSTVIWNHNYAGTYATPGPCYNHLHINYAPRW